MRTLNYLKKKIQFYFCPQQVEKKTPQKVA